MWIKHARPFDLTTLFLTWKPRTRHLFLIGVKSMPSSACPGFLQLTFSPPIPVEFTHGQHRATLLAHGCHVNEFDSAVIRLEERYGISIVSGDDPRRSLLSRHLLNTWEAWRWQPRRDVLSPLHGYGLWT
jgi:hypothetical protein